MLAARRRPRCWPALRARSGKGGRLRRWSLTRSTVAPRATSSASRRSVSAAAGPAPRRLRTGTRAIDGGDWPVAQVGGRPALGQDAGSSPAASGPFPGPPPAGSRGLRVTSWSGPEPGRHPGYGGVVGQHVGHVARQVGQVRGGDQGPPLEALGHQHERRAEWRSPSWWRARPVRARPRSTTQPSALARGLTGLLVMAMVRAPAAPRPRPTSTISVVGARLADPHDQDAPVVDGHAVEGVQAGRSQGYGPPGGYLQ